MAKTANPEVVAEAGAGEHPTCGAAPSRTVIPSFLPKVVGAPAAALEGRVAVAPLAAPLASQARTGAAFNWAK